MKTITFILLLLFVGGCTITSSKEADKYDQAPPKSKLSKNSIHYYVSQLAKQMFHTSIKIDLNQSVAVGTFLPAASLSESSDNSIGHQIQESFTTLAAQAGLTITEFKSMTAIRVNKNSDVMLSRDLAELSQNVDVDYYLTGTFLKQETSYVVNARLIDVKTQNVIAAATDYIPLNSIWSDSKVMLKNQKIYRKGY